MVPHRRSRHARRARWLSGRGRGSEHELRGDETGDGDGDPGDGEQCDDGNADDTDECPGTCQLAYCGDGFLQADSFELCDDGNMLDDDGCVGLCIPAICGDGFLWTGNGLSTQINITKLVGPAPGNGVAFQCADTLGWGACAGSVCHYGTHTTNTSNDGSWSKNGTTEMHFPSAYSSYRSYGNVISHRARGVGRAAVAWRPP